jgi:hypothetical protein
VSRRLLLAVVAAFVPGDGPVLVGLDETIERRRGAKIAAKGIYRDPVRSSKSHFVKASGLRWISMQVLAEIPWAGRIWGLPFLTVLARSERYNLECDRRHMTLPLWQRQSQRNSKYSIAAPTARGIHRGTARGSAVWVMAGPAKGCGTRDRRGPGPCADDCGEAL